MEEIVVIEKTIDELKAEADSLGITYNKVIGAEKLAAKIEEYYASQETSAAIVVVETAKEEDAPVKSGGNVTMRALANAARASAMKTSVVTITDNDQRENNYTTVVSVNCSNAYFDLGTKRIPLNVPVEVEQGFIDVLSEIRIPMHVRDASTGQNKTVLRNRYSIAIDTTIVK